MMMMMMGRRMVRMLMANKESIKIVTATQRQHR